MYAIPLQSVRRSQEPLMGSWRSTTEGRVSAGYYGFNANNSFPFQAIQNLLIPHTYVSGFFEYFGGFGYIWR